MRKHLLLALMVLSLCAAGACQSYTKGLQDTVTKADETAAISAMRTITVAQQAYSTGNNGDYGTFDQLVKGGYLDSRFNSEKPKFRGYVLTLTVSGKGGTEPSYSVNADPEAPAQGRHFYFDSASGLIHVNASQTAAATDPALDQ